MASRFVTRLSSLGLALVIVFTAAAARAQSPTGRIVDAANAFLATLDPAQRKSVSYAFDDEKQRARWSNFPTSFVKRGGISLSELNESQQTAMMAVVASGLSARGFEKVQQIMEGDEANKNAERGNSIFGKDLYYISFLGAPSEKEPWMIQFGGHHLAVNLTIEGDKGILTPTLTGAQPATFKLDGKTIRPLGQESDKGLALIKSLSDEQRVQAVLNYHISDLVLGPGQDGKKIRPEGLKGSEMSEKQRTLLLDLIGEWAGIVNDTAASARMAEIKAGIDETYFAWSGPTQAEAGKNISAYYRIQGPKLVIEYAPQRLGGDPSMHVHTMYRDPTNDYGRTMAKR